MARSRMGRQETGADFLRMLSEHGGHRGRSTARRLDHAVRGLWTLWERRRLDLSVEALVVRSEYEPYSTSRCGKLRGTGWLTTDTRNRVAIPREIAAALDELAVAPSLRRLVHELSERRAITADPPISGYVGLRPSAHGTISMYVHKVSASIALEPDTARAAHQRIGGSLQEKNPTTWFLRLSATDLVEDNVFSTALDLGLAAIEKSEQGPAYEGGKEAARAAAAAVRMCPNCMQYPLTAAGTCMGDCGD